MSSRVESPDWRFSLLVAAVGSLLVTLPAALRCADEGGALIGCWLALTGTAALVVGATGTALGSCPPRQVGQRGAGVLLFGALLAASPLILFASVLKQATHHRPLGAVTFALGAAVVVLGGVAVAHRLFELARTWSARTRGRLMLPSLGAACGVLTVWLAASALGEASVRSGLLDALLLVVLACLAAWLRPTAALARLASRLGWWVWALVVAAGIITLHVVPAVAASVQSGGPVLAVFSGWLTYI